MRAASLLVRCPVGEVGHRDVLPGERVCRVRQELEDPVAKERMAASRAVGEDRRGEGRRGEGRCVEVAVPVPRRALDGPVQPSGPRADGTGSGTRVGRTVGLASPIRRWTCDRLGRVLRRGPARTVRSLRDDRLSFSKRSRAAGPTLPGSQTPEGPCPSHHRHQVESITPRRHHRHRPRASRWCGIDSNSGRRPRRQ